MQTLIRDPLAELPPSIIEANRDRQERLARLGRPSVRAPVRIAIREDVVTDTSINVHACTGQVVIVSEHLVEEAKAIFERVGIGNVTIAAVQRAVAGHFGFSREQFLAHRRHAPLVRARQTAMFLAKEFTLKSLPEIGRAFGGMDHTTILHGVRQVQRRLNRDAAFVAVVDELRQKIRTRAQA
jgi:chromosomal replication initiation ATPase DnaA